jgi:hypothetical protein
MSGYHAARCMAVGCGRFVRAGELFCRRHAVDEDGFDGAEPGETGASDRAQAHRARSAEFRRRLAEGDYRSLFDEQIARAMAQAASGEGVFDELGALRFVMARLLFEEDDLTELATNVAKVAGVAVQTARAQKLLNGDAAMRFTDAVTRILMELDGE